MKHHTCTKLRSTGTLLATLVIATLTALTLAP